MDKLHRITQLKRILAGRRTPISLRQLMERMECSESTARRALHSYRDDFGAPLAFDRRTGGWYLTNPSPGDDLPSLWLSTADILDDPAVEVDQDTAGRRLDGAYGSYTGTPTDTAVLRFGPDSARWVAEEHWHDDQQGSWLPDGRYQLSLPYSQPQELLMEILKYGAACEVVEPSALREAVVERLREALRAYGDSGDQLAPGTTTAPLQPRWCGKTPGAEED